MNFTEQKLTGKASIDKPWLNFYPEQFRNLEIPRITIEAFLKMKTRMRIRSHLSIMEIRLHGNSYGKM